MKDTNIFISFGVKYMSMIINKFGMTQGRKTEQFYVIILKRRMSIIIITLEEEY